MIGVALTVEPVNAQLMKMPSEESCKVSNLVKINEVDSWDNQFDSYGITADPSGLIFKVSPNGYSIQEIDGKTGKVLNDWTYPPNDSYGYWADIAIDSNGDIYVTDGDENKLKKIDNNGNLIQSYKPLEENFFPAGIDIDLLGNIYITNFVMGEIYKLSSKMVLLETWKSGSNKLPAFNPEGIAIDSLNNVYVSSPGTHMILKFDNNGNFITSWGGQGTKAGLFNYPTGIAVDCLNNVYVADHFSGIARIQKFDNNGNYLDSFESETREGMSNESIVHLGIATDLEGNVFLADGFIKKITKYGPPPSDVDNDGIPDFEDVCPNDPTNTCNSNLKIIGYDAEDVDRLTMHDGWLSNNLIQGWDGMKGNGIAGDERIAIYVQNTGQQKITLNKLWINNVEYFYQASSTLPQNNNNPISPRYWLVLKGSDSGPAVTSTSQLAELQAGQKATIVADLQSEIHLGRDIQIKIQNIDSTIAIGTILAGQESGMPQVKTTNFNNSSNNSSEENAKKFFNSLMGANIQRQDASIIFPNNLEGYFPTIQSINDRLERGNIIPASNYHLEKLAYDNGDEIILTEKLVINIENQDEFFSVFQLDPNSYFMPSSIGNIRLDNNYMEQKIKSYLDTCSQINNTLKFCGLSIEEIKNRVLQKIGTHTIVESTVLKKISTLDNDSSFGDPNKVAKVLPTNYQKNDEQTRQILYPLSEQLLNFEKMQIVPSANAQPSMNQRIQFLNGFTIGYGFEKSWSYEFNVLDIIPIAFDAHIESGLGIGLRIPIEVVWAMNSSGPQHFEMEYTLNTQNWSARDYENLLGIGKDFGGNEFKVYLGPKINLNILLFDESAYTYSKEAISTPEDGDFTPPLDNLQTNLEITSYTVDCDVIRTCFELPIGTVGLSLGTRVDLSGEKITFVSQPINSPQQGNEMSLFFNGQKESFTYGINDDTKSFGTEISELKYHSDLHLIPRAMINADIIMGWILPFDLSTGWIDFPEILVNGIVFEKHDGTTGNFEILSSSMELDQQGNNGPPSATGFLSDGTKVSIWTSEPVSGERMDIKTEFENSRNVNLDITVTQNGRPVLDDTGVYFPEGVGVQQTSHLGSSEPVNIRIIFQGYGIGQKTGPIGEEIFFTHVVPEFETISIIMLLIVFIIMVTITTIYKSKIINSRL